jgi:hypothetical protein
MTALGILMSISFVTVSRSKPLDRLSGTHTHIPQIPNRASQHAAASRLPHSPEPML